MPEFTAVGENGKQVQIPQILIRILCQTETKKFVQIVSAKGWGGGGRHTTAYQTKGKTLVSVERTLTFD